MHAHKHLALGTLVVINNDEWDHFRAFSALSPPFNAPVRHYRVVLSAHTACARVGLWGLFVCPKMAQKDFFPICPWTTCKQVFLARFEPMVARFDPRKIPKGLEWAVLGPKMGQK